MADSLLRRAVDRWQVWRVHRAAHRLLRSGRGAMLKLAADRLGRSLSASEQEMLAERFALWLNDESRLMQLVDKPTRTVNLFLSGEIG